MVGYGHIFREFILVYIFRPKHFLLCNFLFFYGLFTLCVARQNILLLWVLLVKLWVCGFDVCERAEMLYFNVNAREN